MTPDSPPYINIITEHVFGHTFDYHISIQVIIGD